MGQTQLLLMVLVMLLIGIAIMVAVYIFNEQAASSNLDRLSAFIVDLGARAQKHYRTPLWMDGGGHSFSKLTANPAGIAWLTQISDTEFGTFTISVAGTATQVTLKGVGVEDGDGDGTNCTIECQVFPDSMSATIINR